jgi:hypothetical protein
VSVSTARAKANGVKLGRGNRKDKRSGRKEVGYEQGRGGNANPAPRGKVGLVKIGRTLGVGTSVVQRVLAADRFGLIDNSHDVLVRHSASRIRPFFRRPPLFHPPRRRVLARPKMTWPQQDFLSMPKLSKVCSLKADRPPLVSIRAQNRLISRIKPGEPAVASSMGGLCPQRNHFPHAVKQR